MTVDASWYREREKKFRCFTGFCESITGALLRALPPSMATSRALIAMGGHNSVTFTLWAAARRLFINQCLSTSVDLSRNIFVMLRKLTAFAFHQHEFCP